MIGIAASYQKRADITKSPSTAPQMDNKNVLIKGGQTVDTEEKIIDLMLIRRDDLIKAMRDCKKGFSVKDRKYLLKTYRSCFIGKEAVDWFLQNFSTLIKTRNQAVKLGKRLYRLGVFDHVLREHDFEDEYLFYRFIESDSYFLDELLNTNGDFFERISDRVLGIKCNNNKYKGRMYYRSFSGKDGIDWMVRNGYVSSRDMGLKLGNTLILRNTIESIDRKYYYEDNKDLLYMFTTNKVDNDELDHDSNSAEIISPFTSIGSYDNLLIVSPSSSISPSQSPLSKSWKSMLLFGSPKKEKLKNSGNITEISKLITIDTILQIDGVLHIILYSLLPSDFVSFCKISKQFYYYGYKFSHDYGTYVMNRISFNNLSINSLSKYNKLILWHGISNHWNHFYSKYLNQLHELIKDGGIPNKLRGKIWKELLDINELIIKNPNMFDYCVNQTTDIEHSIGKDIGRTFINHIDYKSINSIGQIKLFKILKSFSNFKPEIGYCQGMNFIAGALSLTMDSEEAFWVFIKLMKFNHLETLYKKGLPGLSVLLSIFESLIEYHLPNLAIIFKRDGIVAKQYANKWFLTLFGCIVPIDTFLFIFDLFMIDGWSSIMKIGLSILKLSEDRIIKYGTDDLFVYLDSLPIELLNKDKLISYSYNEFNNLNVSNPLP